MGNLSLSFQPTLELSFNVMPPDASQPESPSLRNQANAARSDAELLQALKSGQANALGSLYDRYADPVYGLAVKLLTNTEEAEDLTQEVFLTLMHRNTYDPARGSLISFLMTMTRSRALDRLRSRGVKQRAMQRWGGNLRSDRPPSTPIEQAVISEQAEVVQQALSRLPATERQVLEIAYYDGLSQSEIAAQLEIPLGTVKSRSRQGLIKLRQALRFLIE
jgi:RNA polymerase sigma-70 factor (ECF subfamily)